jgi:cytochrome b subunit of formate dehydrogenase
MASSDVRDEGGMLRRYGGRVIVVHWLFIITFMPLLAMGILLMRDWFAREFHVYGIDYLIRTPTWALDWHMYLGAAVLIVGLVHILLHIGQKEKPILPRNVGADLAANIHHIMYIFHLSPLEERGAGEKYKRHQRMTYVALVYVVALLAVTAFLVWSDIVGELGLVLHVIAGVLALFLSAYRILSLFRKHDMVAIRSILATGKVPDWYAKRRHFLWYREVRGGYKPPEDPEYERYSTVIETTSEKEVVEG